MRRIALIAAILFVVSGCGDDGAATTATSAAASSSTTTVATTTSTFGTTTTAEPSTTRTSFEAPPGTPPDPERGPFVGIWRWTGTHTRYIELFEHGVIATGSIVDDSLQFTRFGEWEVDDGLMTIRFLQQGFEGCDESPGTYTVGISAQNLVMEVVDEPCEGRAVWLLGADETSRTWIPDDAEGP